MKSAPRCTRSLALRACLLLVALVPLVGAGPHERAASQLGYALEQHPELGLSFPLARSYEQMPTQPDERWVRLHYREQGARDETQRALRAEMIVLSIDRVPDPGIVEGTPEAERAELPTNSFERWIARRMPEWRVELGPERKPRDGYEVREYTLLAKETSEKRGAGWACTFRNEERTIVVLGTCEARELDVQSKLWRTSVERLRFSAPAAPDDEELLRSYARLGYSDPERRIAVRKKLPRGWRAEDTENYILVYDTADPALIRKIAYDIELLRGEYKKYFPPAESARTIDAPATVRICKDRDGYLAYGGMKDSAGYWNADSEELVLYDARRPQKNLPDDDSDTFLVLYHEAFHQYIHASTGELAPHPWFNEGHGDFFSGADVQGRIRSIGVNPWRVELARGLADSGHYIPWSRILRYELRPFMDDGFRCYAQSWSMIHFLRLAPEVQKRPDWARILPTYFDTLKSSFAAELSRLEPAQRDDPLVRWKAGFDARNHAVDAAFEGVDFDEIEKAWRAYVARLPGSKPR